MKEVDRKRKKQILFRATPEEKKQLLNNMKAAGYSTLASYLLHMGLRGYIVNINFADVKALLGDVGAVRSELNRIGNNINQVAKHVNQSHEIDAMDFYLLEEEVKSMRSQIEKMEKQIVVNINRKLRDLEES
ncbi:plasmid mobilization relaxosome protein MobC [Lactococcus muris]|uniref:Plasmid mobilization relaxosome protein MobC n=1 Tax=Lactococcus muris TaxID=2941330 RepID=A0ABV4DAY4_9LACT|nr:plasmid mobilization relaxosome protein MobC [Lactococcus ileimucosae]